MKTKWTYLKPCKDAVASYWRHIVTIAGHSHVFPTRSVIKQAGTLRECVWCKPAFTTCYIKLLYKSEADLEEVHPKISFIFSLGKG